MPTKPARTAAKPATKPARKGTVRTSGPKSEVRTRKLSASERASGTAKLGSPKPKRAAAKPKPATKPNARKVPATVAARDAARDRTLARIAKLRASGTKWGAISEVTGLSLPALARLRVIERKGAARF